MSGDERHYLRLLLGFSEVTEVGDGNQGVPTGA